MEQSKSLTIQVSIMTTEYIDHYHTKNGKRDVKYFFLKKNMSRTV